MTTHNARWSQKQRKVRPAPDDAFAVIDLVLPSFRQRRAKVSSNDFNPQVMSSKIFTSNATAMERLEKRDALPFSESEIALLHSCRVWSFTRTWAIPIVVHLPNRLSLISCRRNHSRSCVFRARRSRDLPMENCRAAAIVHCG